MQTTTIFGDIPGMDEGGVLRTIVVTGVPPLPVPVPVLAVSTLEECWLRASTGTPTPTAISKPGGGRSGALPLRSCCCTLLYVVGCIGCA